MRSEHAMDPPRVPLRNLLTWSTSGNKRPRQVASTGPNEKRKLRSQCDDPKGIRHPLKQVSRVL